jgi:hypothetical protein
MLICISVKRETAMTYQERYEKTNVWVARNIAKGLMRVNGKDQIVTEHDEKMVSDAELRDTAMREIVKPRVKDLVGGLN